MKNNQNNNKKPEDSFSFLELYAECIVEAYNEFEDFAKKINEEVRNMTNKY